MPGSRARSRLSACLLACLLACTHACLLSPVHSSLHGTSRSSQLFLLSMKEGIVVRLHNFMVHGLKGKKLFFITAGGRIPSTAKQYVSHTPLHHHHHHHQNRARAFQIARAHGQAHAVHLTHNSPVSTSGSTPKSYRPTPFDPSILCAKGGQSTKKIQSFPSGVCGASAQNPCSADFSACRYTTLTSYPR